MAFLKIKTIGSVELPGEFLPSTRHSPITVPLCYSHDLPNSCVMILCDCLLETNETEDYVRMDKSHLIRKLSGRLTKHSCSFLAAYLMITHHFHDDTSRLAVKTRVADHGNGIK